MSATKSTTSAPAVEGGKAINEKDLKSIVKRLTEDPSFLDELDEDTIIAIKQKMNPAGTIAPVRKVFGVMSLINLREDYVRKFMMTSMISFLYRRLYEFKPAFIEKSEEYCTREMDKIGSMKNPDPAHYTADQWAAVIQKMRDDLSAKIKKQNEEYLAAQKAAITEFLDSVFSFNPDKHVRKAPTTYDADAVSLMRNPSSDTKAAAVVAAVAADKDATLQRETESVTHANPEEVAAYVDDTASIVYRHAKAAGSLVGHIYKLIGDGMAMIPDAESKPVRALEDVRQIIFKHNKTIDAHISSLAPFVSTPLSGNGPDESLRILPPADVFHHFNRYVDSHYETLRLCTDTLYQAPTDIDNIAIFYDAFENIEEAQAFTRAHENEFTVDPKIIENGAVTLLGPFRENREKVDFYTKNTEVLRAMMEQLNADHKLGKEIAAKRIETGKRKNIREVGSDDPGLKDYMRARGVITAMGKQPQLSPEDKAKLALAEQERARFETPEGSLAVRVLAPVLDEDGVPLDIKQSFFHSEATMVPQANK